MNADELRRILVLASAFKEGDVGVGGTTDEQVRRDARQVLLSTPIGAIHNTVLIDDGVTAALQRSRDVRADSEIAPLTIAQVRNTLLSSRGAAWARARADALGSEVIAALVKVMTDDELAIVGASLGASTGEGDATIGTPAHLGSRIQPNSAGDDEREIVFSILEGQASTPCRPISHTDTTGVDALAGGATSIIPRPTRSAVFIRRAKQQQPLSMRLRAWPRE